MNVESRKLLAMGSGSAWRLAAIWLCLGALGCDAGRPWPAPAEARRLASPEPVSSDALADARRIYAQRCVGCHGQSGRGDGTALRAERFRYGDLTDAALMTTQTDGEIWWKLSEGRRPMPGFKSKLSEAERRAIREGLLEIANQDPDVALCNRAALDGALMLDRMEDEDARRQSS